jgi:hypothetical protein
MKASLRKYVQIYKSIEVIRWDYALQPILF